MEIQIASYAASAVDENEENVRDVTSPRRMNEPTRDAYYYRNPSGPTSPIRKSSTPKNRVTENTVEDQRCNNRHSDRYIHPLALKLKLQGKHLARHFKLKKELHCYYGASGKNA